METIYVVIVVVAISVILTLVSKRQKESAWEGSVEAIKPYSYEKEEGQQHEGVKIHYRRTDGRKGKLDLTPLVFRQLYADLEVGDILTKVKGEYMPKASKP